MTISLTSNETTEYLHQDLCQLLQSYGIGKSESDKVWETVREKYCEPHRHYHTLVHINDLLGLADRYDSLLSKPRVVRLAIYFHDIVYDPASKTNEEDSATLFRDTFFPGKQIDEATIDLVCHYILKTKSHSIDESDCASDEDLAIFIDMDMSILGAEQERYEKYIKEIRQEYCMYSDFAYGYGRFRALQSFIAKPDQQVFCSRVFKPLNSRAHENIGWELNLIQQDFYSNFNPCTVS
jgi:predicted metal-dependent HD superfamily phosphohydrolase